MKKILALVLALALVLGCTAAMAEIEIPMVTGNYNDVTVNWDDETNLLIGYGVSDTGAAIAQVEFYRLDMASNTQPELPEAVLTTDGAYSIYDIELPGIVLDETSFCFGAESWWGEYGEIWDYSIEGSEVAYNVYVIYEDGTYDVERIYINATQQGQVVVSGRAWYPNNHAVVFGPQMADSWKTYGVVDLSVEGTQTLKLVAAGAWEIGKVNVTVTGDEVVVDYLMHEDVITKDVHDDINVDAEYLNIYADVESMDITAESTFAFGVPFSIANDLGGDTTVVLYVENVVDYPSTSPFVYRFWPNLSANKAIVEAMNALLVEVAE